MHLFGRRCIVITRREARQITAATTAKSAFGTVRRGPNNSERRATLRAESGEAVDKLDASDAISSPGTTAIFPPLRTQSRARLFM